MEENRRFLKRKEQAFISGQSEPIEKAIPSRYGAGRAGPGMMGLASILRCEKEPENMLKSGYIDPEAKTIIAGDQS